MSSPTTLPPPPKPAQDSKSDTVLQGIGGFLSAGAGMDFAQTPLGKQLAASHQQKMNDAAMQHHLVSVYGGALATGNDPVTGSPLTAEQRADLEQRYKNAWGAYQKIVGVNPEAKQALQKAGHMLEHVVTFGKHKIPPPPQAAAAPQGGLPPPPSETAVAYPSEQVQSAQKVSEHQRISDIDTANRIKVLKAGPHHLQSKMVKGPNGPVMASYDPTTGEYIDQQGQTIEGAEPYVRPSAAMLPKLAWTMRNGKPVAMMRDPQTNQMIPGTENPDIMPPPGMLEHVHEGEFSWVDADGIMHRTPYTSTTRPVLPSSGSGGAGAGAASSGKPPVRRPGTSPTATAPAKPAGPRGDRIIGDTGKMSAADRMVSAEAVKLADKAKPMVDILDASEDYFRSGKFTPRQDLGIIVRAVRAMNPGSVRLPQKELELEIKAGSYGDRFSRWYSTATTGLLPDDQRADLMNVIRSETEQTAKSAAEAWDSAFAGKKAVPPYLKRFSSKKSVGMPPPPAGAKPSKDPLGLY